MTGAENELIVVCARINDRALRLGKSIEEVEAPSQIIDRAQKSTHSTRMVPDSTQAQMSYDRQLIQEKIRQGLEKASQKVKRTQEVL